MSIPARKFTWVRLSASVLIGTAITGCSRPPVGIYQVASQEGVEFVRRDGKPLLIDIYSPVNGPTLRPAVLLFHGGGWSANDRRTERPLARFLASMGYTAATADYRLCKPGGPHFPIPVQDALAAVKFMRSHAAEHGVDPGRIAVSGDSAGGELALLIGLAKDPAFFGDDSYPGVSSEVSAVINHYGPTDLPAMVNLNLLLGRIGRSYLGGTLKEIPEAYRQASPISYVRRDAPPVLTLHGDKDVIVPFAQAVELHEAILKAGGRSTLVRVPGTGHNWVEHFNSEASLRTLPVLVQFLARVFPQREDSTYPTDGKSL